MKRFFISIYFIFFAVLFISAQNWTTIDNFYRDGKYNEGLKEALTLLNQNKTNISLLWRISRFYLEIGDETKDKKEKIATYSKGMEIAEPYINNTNDPKEERAQLFFWYTANFASRSKAIGIMESINTLPKLFELVDQNIAIDPTFAAPYLLKGRIDLEVPSFLGGNVFRMGESFSLAIKYNPKDLSVLVDAADGFYKRNWDANRKKREAEKQNKTDGTPENLSDREYSKILLEMAFNVYKEMKEPTKRDTLKYNEGLELYKKFK